MKPLAPLVLVLVTSSAALAEDFGATATARKPIAATNREDPTASGSTIELRDRTRALEDVDEALVELPGLRVQHSGGTGAPAVVALRGAELSHTTVLLDAIPLAGPDAGAFDLSLLPLSALDRIEVYRSGAPVFYGEGAIGGVVRFVPAIAKGSELRASTGYGSFGRAELRTTGALSRGGELHPNWLGHVRLLRADNDYAYIDDGQTRFDASDDRELHQQNADLLQGDGLMHASIDLLGGRLSALALGHGRLAGIPGPLAAPTRNVRHKLVRAVSAVAFERETLDARGERLYRVQLVASGSHQQSALSDLEGELGLARSVESNDVWQRGYLRAAGSLRVLAWLEPTLVASLTTDQYQPEDSAAFTLPPRPSERSSVAVALEPRVLGYIFGMPAELRPSVRLETSQTHVRSDTGLQVIDEQRDVLAPTYRLAGALAPARELSLAASVATGTRLPTIVELFGDRMFLEQNPSLEPERSTAIDAGAVLQGRAGVLSGSVEVRGFLLLIDDLIRYERTSQYTVRPANVASAEVLGTELGAIGRYGRSFSLAASITGMQTKNAFDRELPLRPPLQALLRPQVALFPDFADELSVFAEAHHVSFVYLDDANLTHLPGRTLFSAGASIAFLQSQLLLAARVHNVFDTLATDLLSRPMPGREARIELTVREAID